MPFTGHEIGPSLGGRFQAWKICCVSKTWVFVSLQKRFEKVLSDS